MYASGTGPGTGSDELLLWVDYAQGAVTCLCAQPNCDHRTDACTARVPLPEGSQYTPVILCRAAPDGRLILYVSAEAGSIWVANADGTDRRAVVDWTADSIYPWLADGEALYYTGFQASGAEVSPTILYRVPLDGGQPEEVLRLRSTGDGTEQEEIIGAWGRNAVTLYADLRDVMTVAKPDLPPDVTPEEHAAAWAAYDAEMAGHKVTRQVCLRKRGYRRNDGAGPVGDRRPGRRLADRLAGRQAVPVERRPERRPRHHPRRPGDRDGGASGRRSWAGLSHGSGLSGIVGGQMLVNCYPADAPGGHRVAVDPATGACTEIRLMRLEPATGAEQPMNLYGAGGGYVLLACEQRQTRPHGDGAGRGALRRPGLRGTVRPFDGGGLFGLPPELDRAERRVSALGGLRRCGDLPQRLPHQHQGKAHQVLAGPLAHVEPARVVDGDAVAPDAVGH